ncbi:MAG TPA: universal stress protein [Solirubrobacteraceae bacterium]|jgi:nucleotide-binding universal stress UspA family protein|nr:universal stress protein [Solirubrobacteraceae bacterium]
MATGADTPLLLCYDGSDPAKHAIERAADLLRTRNAVVLTVWQTTVGLGSFAWAGATENMLDYVELDRAAAELGGRIVSEGVRVAEAAGLQAEPLAVKATGPVWTTILEIAERHDASMIVIGSRGLTGLRSILLGSVSTAVVHHADRPTLVIHSPGDDDASERAA